MYKLVTLLNDKAVSTDKVWDKAQAYRKSGKKLDYLRIAITPYVSTT
jgi:hypothetical protein